MLNENVVYVGAVLSAVGVASYLIPTLKGRTKPNRVTWFFWGLAPLIAFVAELDEGVGPQALMTLMVGLGPAMIFLASFVNPAAYWRLGRFDIGCGVFCLLAITLWLVTEQGTLAIALTIAADAIAGIPTVVKAYRHPRTESPWVFWVGSGYAAITLLSIDHWDFAHYGFPAYILVIDALLGTLIAFRLGERVRGSGDPGSVQTPA